MVRGSLGGDHTGPRSLPSVKARPRESGGGEDGRRRTGEEGRTREDNDKEGVTRQRKAKGRRMGRRTEEKGRTREDENDKEGIRKDDEGRRK